LPAVPAAGEPIAATIETDRATLPARQEATAKLWADSAPVTPWSSPAAGRQTHAGGQGGRDQRAAGSDVEGEGEWSVAVDEYGDGGQRLRAGRDDVATTSSVTVCWPFGVPAVLNFGRWRPLGVTAALVPACVVVLAAELAPRPAAIIAVAAIHVARTASGYPREASP
jgi:hypothetical protein